MMRSSRAGDRAAGRAGDLEQTPGPGGADVQAGDGVGRALRLPTVRHRLDGLRRQVVETGESQELRGLQQGA